MVERDDFRDHGDVLPWVEEHRNLRQLDLENRGRFDVESGALDDCVLVPLLEHDDDFDALLLPNRPDSENRGNVDQSHTADLHEMALHVVPATNQDVVAALARDDEIIGNQTVSALHEVEHALRFSNSTLSREEEADTEHVRERSMQRSRGRELHLEHWLDAPIEFGGLETRSNQWNPGCGGDLAQSRREPLTLCNEYCGDRKGKKKLENFFPLGRCKRREIGDLGLAKNLKAFRRESLDVAGQDEAGARHLGVADNTLVTGARLDLLELKRPRETIHQLSHGNLRSRHYACPLKMTLPIAQPLSAQCAASCRPPSRPT